MLPISAQINAHNLAETSTVRTSAIQQIIDGIDSIEADERAKQHFHRLVCNIAAAHGASGFERTERVKYARELLAVGVSRPTIRDRVMARYDLSKRQAYRVIDAALNCAAFRR